MHEDVDEQDGASGGAHVEVIEGQEEDGELLDGIAVGEGEPDLSEPVGALRAEVAILKARLLATETIARERQEHIDDLRAVMGMLPGSGERPAGGRPGEGSGRSAIWTPPQRGGPSPTSARPWTEEEWRVRLRLAFRKP